MPSDFGKVIWAGLLLGSAAGTLLGALIVWLVLR